MVCIDRKTLLREDLSLTAKGLLCTFLALCGDGQYEAEIKDIIVRFTDVNDFGEAMIAGDLLTKLGYFEFDEAGDCTIRDSAEEE